jgi:AbrB family looped-hinge helix DNA binding protein
MATVTVSPKFQVVIPQAVREELRIKPGQKLEIMSWGNKLVLSRVVSMADLRGLCKGIPNDFVRDKSDRYADVYTGENNSTQPLD